MVKMFACSVQESDSEDYSTMDQHFDAIMPADRQVSVGPSTCVFWCAVALGALVKGQPIESVSNRLRHMSLRRQRTIAVRLSEILSCGGWYDTNMSL